MTIIEKIKQSVEGATGMPFLYHAAGELNELLALCKELPVAYSFLIDSGTIDDVNGRYHERVTLAVMFCDKTEFDFNALENEEIIDRMKVKAYKWMQSLRMSNALHVVSVNNTQRLYDNTTDILTGFAVNITIEDVAGVGECELPQVVIDVDKNGSYNVVGVDNVRVNVVPRLEELEVTQNGEYLPPTDIHGFSKVNVDVQPTLEELTITENGVYLPQEGVDGFRKVVAEFDTSSLPKVKVSTFRISNDCIKDGRLEGDTLIDLSNVTSMHSIFRGCTNLEYINMDDWNVNGIPMDFASMFQECHNIKELDFSKWNNVYLTDISYMFLSCEKLEKIKGLDKFDTSLCTNFTNVFGSSNRMSVIDITSWDFSSAKTIGMIAYRNGITNIVGGKSIDVVISDNISTFTNAKKNISFYVSYLGYTNLDRASLRSIINGIADLTGQTAQTITLGATLIAKLTEEDIAIATAKNWTIV